ncbi:MAG: hypothetical protein E7015_00570 [Alphaproteobacteria bacterium]|nr:hypothetical protein [Alphaproteobacteria bacterium]
MYMNTRDIEKEGFSVRNIVVPCSQIKITHANDNRAPFKERVKQSIVWILVAIMIIGIYLL